MKNSFINNIGLTVKPSDSIILPRRGYCSASDNPYIY